MFANKSHSAGSGGARVQHDSPCISLGVILPCQPQGELICIASVTNLAVHSLRGCTRHACPPTARHPISLQFFFSLVPFSFSLHSSHYAPLLRGHGTNLPLPPVIHNIYPFWEKAHLLADLVLYGSLKRLHIHAPPPQFSWDVGMNNPRSKKPHLRFFFLSRYLGKNGLL